MRRALSLVLVGAAVAAVAVAAGRTDRASAKPEAGSLVGTGSTFVFPLVSKWIPAIAQAYGTKVTYTGTGSGTGISQITARAVDFGASDAPLSPDQLSQCKSCVVIPWALAALSVPYNLPGVNGRVRLSGPVLANIYLGNITTWNNPAIKAMNPKLDLPNTKITPVFRADSSGSTYAYTEFLADSSPQFKSKVGVSTVVNFPTGTGARGSAGVAGIVKSTPGALTYVDAAYATTNKLTFASIKNKTGKFATPGLRGIKAAVSQVPKKVTSISQLKIVNPPKSAGKLAYPICTFTYVIVATKSGDKAADLRKFIYWDVTQGQKFGPPLWFQPLPVPVQAFAFREIKKIQS